MSNGLTGNKRSHATRQDQPNAGMGQAASALTAHVQLNSCTGVYFDGDTVSGDLYVHTNNDVMIKAIYVKVRRRTVPLSWGAVWAHASMQRHAGAPGVPAIPRLNPSVLYAPRCPGWRAVDGPRVRARTGEPTPASWTFSRRAPQPGAAPKTLAAEGCF